MVDGDPEILFDRRDELSGTLDECRVNLVSPFSAGVGYEGVTRNGQERHGVGCRIKVHDHIDIAIDTGGAPSARPVLWILNFQAAAGSRSDEQNIHRRSGALEVTYVLPLEQRSKVVIVANDATHYEHYDNAKCNRSTDKQLAPTTSPASTVSRLVLDTGPVVDGVAERG